MDDKITELYGNISVNDYEEFIDDTKSEVSFIRQTDCVSRDFSWIPTVEKAIPYLDNIIRNPRKFIVQEEDIVIVEKAKKIATETIRHLAQNTNYIQDVDEDGMIKPSKVLNINKEETWELYENRFIFTLVKELARFIRKYTDRDLEPPHTEISNRLNYTGHSIHNNEDINITLSIQAQRKNNELNNEEDTKELVNKIEFLRNIVADFENSEFIRSLSQCVPVTSPIRKTNVILKDANFQNALELWEFIMNSELGDPIDRSSQEEDLSDVSVRKKIDLTYYLNSLIINSEVVEDTSTDLLVDKILELLEDYIDDNNITEKKLTKIINNEIKNAIKKKKNRENDIKNIYIKFNKSHDNFMKEIGNLI